MYEKKQIKNKYKYISFTELLGRPLSPVTSTVVNAGKGPSFFLFLDSFLQIFHNLLLPYFLCGLAGDIKSTVWIYSGIIVEF